ncbi:MAG: YceI family protein [Bacteroidota bacterium]
MKTQKKLITGYLILVMLLIAGSVLAQQTYQLNTDNSSMEVSGTSSVHDWAMDVNNFDGTVTLKTQKSDIKISSLFFEAKTKSILGDKKLMNKKTHEALKADDHSSITFRFANIKNLNTSGNDISGTIEGYLTIAGKTRKIELAFSGKQSDNQLKVKDTYTLNMRDYNVEPPTAMLGSIKTDDKVLVKFDVVFKGKDYES